MLHGPGGFIQLLHGSSSDQLFNGSNEVLLASLEESSGLLRLSCWGFEHTSSCPSSLHQSLTALSLHQTQIQKSTILLEGAGPLSQGRVPTATWRGRGGPHRRRRPCCPVSPSLRRNTSTYPCCWRKRASAPLTTPSTKVTDQILQLLLASFAVESDRNKMCLWASSQLVSSFAFRYGSWFFKLCFSSTIPTSLAAGFPAKLPFVFVLFFKKSFSMVFFIAWIANRFFFLFVCFCSICTLKNCVNCEIFS